jgi:hypothetical protein
MSNVQPQTQTNPFFLNEAGDYLEANGYTRKEGELVTGYTYFFKNGKGVVIYNDNVDFMIHHDEEHGQRKAGYSRYMQLSGIADLNIFKWMLLFHIADIVPLKEFIRETRAAQITADLFTDVLQHFTTSEKSLFPVH